MFATLISTSLLSCSLFTLEIILTRIYSVTLLYHFAFLVVSIALFGISFGAIIGYALKDKASKSLPLITFLYSVSIAISTLLLLKVPPISLTQLDSKALIIFNLNLLNAIIPFTIGGLAISLLITQNKNILGKIYGADLLGAALGGPLAIIAIQYLGIISSLITTALLGLISSFLLYTRTKDIKMQSTLKLLCLSPIAVLAIMVLIPNPQLARIRSSKPDTNDKNPIFEKWNIYSRVTLSETDSCCYKPLNPEPKALGIQIDGSAFTAVLKYEADIHKFDFLKQDIANIVHHIKPGASVLIIGSGGGKDILSALIMNQEHITGLEINSTIVNLLKGPLKEYSGNLTTNPKINIINTEARSWIESQNKEFDVIQMSLIDTWAASSSGAYSLTENGLYTIEAMCTYFNALSENGIMSTTRWYTNQHPNELYRLVSLFAESLKTCLKAPRPEKHIIIVEDSKNTFLASVLVSKPEFSDSQKLKISDTASSLGFAILNPPDSLFNDKARAKLGSNLGVNLSPTTDESPYFFNMVRPTQAMNVLHTLTQGTNSINTFGTTILMLSIFTSILLTGIMFLTPVFIQGKEIMAKLPIGKTSYFMVLGLGFMLIEVSLLQKFSIFLGHPSFGLAFVLSPLLFFAGLGSLFTQKQISKNQNSNSSLLLIIIMLGIFEITTRSLFPILRHQNLATKTLFTVVAIAPLSFFLGTALPLGLSKFMKNNEDLALWAWSMNGAFSILGSTLAILISLSYSISTAFMAGALCYVFALWIYSKLLK